MKDRGRRRPRSKAGEELVLHTITEHAESLLRTARRHSLCFDDAQDAYQRALEIFMRNADRLEPGRAAGWLHTVVKHEALDVRDSRQRHVASEDPDLDAHEAPSLPTPEEQLLSFDMVSRSAEALQRLKPQEVRALWLKAQGHSYSDIGAITGWSHTKVNRCLAEGRRSFLERYAGIESGEECRRWAPVLTALVDGEATPEQLTDLRPHLRNCAACRATLKALRDSSAPIAAVLPVPLVVAGGGGLDAASGMLLRAYEAVTGGLHERAIGSATKMQAAVEAAAAGKVAAVAASAAAVAGGGYATVERVAPGRSDRPAAQERAEQREKPRPERSPPPARVRRQTPPRVPEPARAVPPQRRPDPPPKPRRRRRAESPEFGPARRSDDTFAGASSANRSDPGSSAGQGASAQHQAPAPSPEFAPSPKPPSSSGSTAPEFGP